MSINGIKAAHAQISDTCRKNLGNDGAFNMAVHTLEKAYFEAIHPDNRGNQIGVKYHVVLFVEPPRGDKNERV